MMSSTEKVGFDDFIKWWQVRAAPRFRVWRLARHDMLIASRAPQYDHPVDPVTGKFRNDRYRSKFKFLKARIGSVETAAIVRSSAPRLPSHVVAPSPPLPLPPAGYTRHR